MRSNLRNNAPRRRHKIQKQTQSPSTNKFFFIYAIVFALLGREKTRDTRDEQSNVAFLFFPITVQCMYELLWCKLVCPSVDVCVCGMV